MKVEKPESDYFCILPWIHMHTLADGTTYPCCLGHTDYPIGNTKQSSYLDIWNSEEMKKLRLNMLTNKPSAACSRCYEHENAGTESLRMTKNRDFKHKYNRTKLTKEDGSLDEVHMSYLDIRFSNICNMRCRTCGPTFSSLWHTDATKMKMIDSNAPRILKAKDDINELFDEVKHWINDVEEIYFAGGEPLIMDEHYKLLEHLISIGKTDIDISYNTNFSKLTYKNKDVIELWKQFKHIKVGASLDATHTRGECLRKGTVWKEIEENRIRLQQEAPHVEFKISATVSAFNAQHVIDFFDEWLAKGWVTVNHIDINLLLYPTHFRAQILPESIRKSIQYKIDDFLIRHNVKEVDTHGRAYSGLIGFKNFLDKDLTSQIPEFLKWSNLLDSVSGDSLFTSIPELNILKNINIK